MKKQVLQLLLFVSFTTTAYSQWSQDTLRSERLHLSAVTFGDKVYFIGGEKGNYLDYEFSEVAVYNCITSAWESSTALSSARSNTTCASGDSGIYVLGGRNLDWTRTNGFARNFNASNRVDIFKNGAWTIDSIPHHVWGGEALKVGSKILFAGFVDSINYLTSEIYASNKVYIFDESTGLWSMDSLSSARTELGAATDGSIAIFAGGVNGLGITSDVVDIYNGVNNSWTTATLSVARGYVGGGYSNGKFYFAGGVLSGIVNQSSDVVDVYDGSAWTTTHLSAPRAGVMVAAVNDYVYFMGGGQVDLSLLMLPNGGGTSKVVDVLNSTSGDWSQLDFFSAHMYGGHTTWGNQIFVGGGGKQLWQQSNQLYIYTRVVEIRDVTLGLSELNGGVSFEVYPNPSTGPFILLLPEARAEISVKDIVGQEVMNIQSMDRTTELQLERNGIYFVTVKTKHGTATRKIIVGS